MQIYISKEQRLIGKFLKQKREENKTKVIDLCNKIQRSSTYYYKLERGLVPFNTLIVRRLFDFYEINYEKSPYSIRSKTR